MPDKKLSAIGDSHTDWESSNGPRPSEVWPCVLRHALRDRGCTVARPRGFGRSGDTSAQVLARIDSMFTYDTPDLAFVFVGTNDPAASINQAATQVNVQAILKALKHGAIGAGLGGGVTVATEASLPARGRPGQRYVVLADGDSAGGVAAVNPSDAPTSTGAGGGAMTVWENRNPLAGPAGWGRIAKAVTAPTVVKRIVVIPPGYQNFTTGGDSLGSPQTNNANVRSALTAAVAAENVNVTGVASVIYADLYAFQKSRIQAGTDPDFKSVTYDQTRSWQAADGNVHHNAYGQWLVAQAVLAALPAKWISDLS